MALFLIEDDERSNYVRANNMTEAIAKWRSATKAVDHHFEDVFDPQVVTRVCFDQDLIIDSSFLTAGQLAAAPGQAGSLSDGG